MAVLRSDRIGVPPGLHERVLAQLRSDADDALAGRIVWSAASLPGGHTPGRRLRERRADRVGGTIQVRPVVAAR